MKTGLSSREVCMGRGEITAVRSPRKSPQGDRRALPERSVTDRSQSHCHRGGITSTHSLGRESCLAVGLFLGFPVRLKVVGKRVQELSFALPRGGRKRGRTAIFCTENKALIFDPVWKATCLLLGHDGSIPSIGTRHVSDDRWEFAGCIADLAMGRDNCGPSV